MGALRLLVWACTAMAVSSQTCPPSTVLFLLDMSENAGNAATDVTRYDILQSEMRKFLSHPALANLANDIRVAIYGYSSHGASQLVAPWKTPAQTLLMVSNINSTNEGGSWTYVGLTNITIPPPTANNLLKLISSQGSTTATRTNMATYAAKVVHDLGWRISVTAVQGQNEINMTEMTAVNNGQTPNMVRDSTGNKGYRELAADLNTIPGLLGCTSTPPDQICQQCQYEAGFYHAPHDVYCDAYINCKDKPATTRACPQGTFYKEDAGNCYHINAVACPVGVCTTGTPANTYYASYLCCNKFFECVAGSIIEHLCAVGKIFNKATKACESSADMECGEVGRHICGVQLNVTVAPETARCNVNCQMLENGDPCNYRCNNQVQPLPAGTAWDAPRCTLVHSDACKPSNDTTTRDLSTVCTANFLATFNDGSRQVYNQRTGSFITVYTTTQETIFADNSAIFTAAMTNPYIYYFYLANVDYGVDVAFRLLFKLSSPTMGVVYDLMSNNYCAQCPETISITVTATSSTDRTVTARFKTTQLASVTATINLSNIDDWMEIVVVFGDTSIYGVLKELRQDATTLVKTSQFTTFTKSAGSTIATNKCGIMLGKGPNQHLQGSINKFALYRFCQDISSVTK